MPPVLAHSESPQSHSLSNFMSAVLDGLNTRGVRYCVLHAYEDLPHDLPSDLDIAIASADFWRVPGVLAAIEALGYRPVQLLNYSARGYYFVFAWIEDGAIRTAAVDFISEHRQGIFILNSADELLLDRRRFRGFWIPSAAAEYRYLLSKKVLKGSLSERQSQQIAALANELGREQARRVCADLFGNDTAEHAATASAQGALAPMLPALKKRMWERVLTRRPWMPLWCVLTEIPRAISRFMRPSGMVVAVVGPDGAGKTTLLENISAQVEGAFRTERIFHWRPGLLFRRPQRPETQPHARASFGLLRSVAHLLGHFADHVAGYAALVRPALARSGLVLFDRCFHDLLADPGRYRYNGPARLPALLSRFVPRPDVMFVLDAPGPVVLKRKTETTAEQIAAVRGAYGRLLQLPFARRIDAAGNVDAVALAAATALADVMRDRMKLRHAEWLTPSSDGGLEQVVTRISDENADNERRRRFTVLPRMAQPRWLTPADAPAQPLDVYEPYRLHARVLKALLPFVSRGRRAVSVPGLRWIDDLAGEIFGTDDLRIAISVGAPGPYRKAIVQIGSPQGVRGFLKVPLTDEAGDRVRNEARTLARLGADPGMRAFVPKTLYAGEWNGRFILLTAPIEGKPGPLKLGAAHRLFLERLAGLHLVSRKLSALAAETRRECDGAASAMSPEHVALIDQALRIVEGAGDRAVRCGLTHGDFAPWNTRLTSGGLIVFDWESAEDDKPCDWDALHFETQAASLLGVRPRPAVDLARECLLLYLANSLARLVIEQGARGKDFTYRLQRLRREVQA